VRAELPQITYFGNYCFLWRGNLVGWIELRVHEVVKQTIDLRCLEPSYFQLEITFG
jgi:hypothetical protein